LSNARRRTALALAGILLLGGAACSSGRDALTVYSGRDEALVGPLLERFAEESGISVDIRYGDSTDLALLIAEEGENSPADVFFSQSPGAVEYLGTQDLLGEIDEATLEKVDEPYRSADGGWVGISARQRVLVYNSELVSEDELPDSVLDLVEPAYEGRVAVAPTNASFQDFVTAMRQQLGDEQAAAWLTGMAENGSPTFPDNNSIVDAVARGEIPFGLVNHYYNFRYVAEDPDTPSVNHVFPGGDIGALLIESSATVLASSDKSAEAQEFIAFLLEEDSQAYFAEETFEYPLVDGVEPAAALPPLDSLQIPDVDITDLGGLERTVEMIEESGLL
jgi:iron(III) transport system substrate-binding protein